FDCVEFDPRLRWIDVMNDMAFLIMDLVSRQRADLAFLLLSRYLEITGDYEGLRVLPFYAVYRALVRAKIDAITAESVPARQAELHARLQLRIRAAASWMSQRLVPEVRAIRIRSDVERKRLAGIGALESATAAARQGIYSPEFSHRT